MTTTDLTQFTEQISKMRRAGPAMGASKPWPKVMKRMTVQEKMDASAIREYFKPLEDWLTIQNANVDDQSGWSV